MESKDVDLSEHPTIAINTHRPTGECQSLRAKTYQKPGSPWQVRFHLKALTTEVCQDNTAFVVNVFRASQQERRTRYTG